MVFFRDDQRRICHGAVLSVLLSWSMSAAGAGIVQGNVYRIVHADGRVVFTNVKPATAAQVNVLRLYHYRIRCGVCGGQRAARWAQVPLNRDAYRAIIASSAWRQGVDPAFVRAVIHAESGFDPHAVSARGARGLMQLMPDTARAMGVSDAFDVRQNIRGGVRYLARLLREFDGNRKLAAAAYNAGPGRVRAFGGIPPYPETQAYVRRVDVLYQRYRVAATRHRESSGLRLLAQEVP